MTNSSPGSGNAECIDVPLIDALLQRTLRRARATAPLPESTYRVQFHKGFTFEDAAAIVPYLAELGVTHLYASPILKAVAGSTHGYDVTDHSMLNPELGTNASFEVLIRALEQHGLKCILDTVPNHVGIATNDNAWWNDVLENGRASIYSHYFDINWHESARRSLHGRVLLPLLGGTFAETLARIELKLSYENGAFFVGYHQRRFPIAPTTYGLILERNIGALEPGAEARPAILNLIADTQSLGRLAGVLRHDQKEQIKRRLAELIQEQGSLQRLVAASVAEFNRSEDLLAALLDAQAYRLACWRTAADEINYRRFFDINDLASLAMERPDVFEATHAFTLQLLAEGKISGLRIDHPDGLYDPAGYLRRLQQHYVLTLARKEYSGNDWPSIRALLQRRLEHESPRFGENPALPPLYVLVEKILAANESLPRDWDTHGTTGYDFLNFCNGLFVDANNAAALGRVYHRWTGESTTFDDLAYQKKQLILDRSLASELHSLAMQLDRLAQQNRSSQDFTFASIQSALREVIACFPVYRTYITAAGVSDVDRAWIDRAIAEAKRRNSGMDPGVFDFVRGTLLLESGDRAADDNRAEQLRFAGKFQQLTSPATAKGIEDTAFYVYNRLLSVNEVGGDPSQLGIEPQLLHDYFIDRQRNWPYAMSTLSTHDTKRSEDVRARINVLSEIPEEWEACLHRWGTMNKRFQQSVDGHPAPDRNEEYAIYQTLLGAWPLSAWSLEESEIFVRRVQACLTKAMREAKQYTTWTNVNEPHETAVTAFVSAILDRDSNREFVDDFGAFQKRISNLGLLNSLSQSLLKLTAPGVPDTYQGTELWDFSLVDPDNRREIDYAKRARLQADLPEHPDMDDLIDNMEDGRLKLLVHRAALRLRRQYPGLFTLGEYIPLAVTGRRARHVFAFARRHQGITAITVVGRLFAGLADAPPAARWDGTRINLSFPVPTLRNVLSSTAIKVSGSGIDVSPLLASLPCAILVSN